MRDDDTQSFQTVDTERHEVVREEAAPPGPPPGPPPHAWINDIWPWLGLLALLAAAGLLVYLFVLRDNGGSKQTVPAVVGLRQQVAIRRLTADGYDVKAVLEPANRPRGIVVSQEPGGGSQLPKGSAVTLHIANGRRLVEPTTTTAQTTTKQTTTVSAPTSQVPDVSGQEMSAGAGQVEAAGFVAETDPVEGGGAPGTIVQESPPGGSQAKAGETVTLGVATGSNRRTVTIPDVTGKSAADARAALLQAKLTVRTTYEKGQAGVVLGQEQTGTAPAYTQVTISVGK